MYSAVKAPIQCKFMGGFRIFDGSGSEIRFTIAKGAAIIAYLALSPFDSVRRGDLTGLLWSEQPEATARTALRQCLHQTKMRLASLDPDLLTITNDTVQLDRSRLSSDIGILTDDGTFGSSPQSLLKGFEDLDPAYAEWVREIRDQTEQQLRNGLQLRIENETLSQQERLDAARSLHSFDPSREVAARKLIEDAISRNDHVSLLEVYSALWEALEDMWGEEPSLELQALVGEGRARMLDPVGQTTKLTVATGPKYLTVLALQTAHPEAEQIAAFQIARDIVEEHGGTVLSVSKQGLMAAFGLPQALETDARFAVEAAIATRRALSRVNDFQGGIGLAAGLLKVEATPDEENAYTLTGQAQDHAIALSAQSEDCSIFATDRTIRRLNDKYVTLGEKALTDPATGIVRVISRKPAHGPNTENEEAGKFVGRSPFLGALNATWLDAREHQSLEISVIEGPAGVGKTRLANHFLSQLESDKVTVARASCADPERSAPLEPLLAIFESLNSAGQSRDQTEKEQTVLDGSVMDPQTIAQKLFDAVAGKPVALLLDDWQWADDATRLALHRFVSFEHNTPILVLLTVRGDLTDEWLHAAGQKLTLPNMMASEVGRKASSLLSHPLEQREAEEIYQKSGGNPLFVEEICHAIAQADSLNTVDQAADLLPATIHSLLSSRIDRLAPEDLDVVHAASVQGDQLETELLSEVLGKAVPDATILRLCALDVLTAGGEGKSPRFKHGIARDVVYRMMPEERRKSLHLRYAERFLARAKTISDGDFKFSEPLALHYRGAGNFELALRFTEMSGDKAFKASSLDRAMRHYEMAMDLIDELPLDHRRQKRKISLSKRWAVPCIYAASPNHLPKLIEAEVLAIELGDLNSVCETRYWIGYLHFVLGNHPRALESLNQAAAVALETQNDRMLVESQAVSGCILTALARYGEAEIEMRSAISIKENNPGKSGRTPVMSVYTRANLGLLLADRGAFEAADQQFEEALSRVEGFEHEVESSILNFAAAAQIWRGNWCEALRQATVSRARSERVSSPYLIAMSRCIWGYAKWRVDGSSQALEMLARSAAWMEERGMKLYISLIYGWLADAMAQSGHHTAARRAFERAKIRADEGEWIGLSMASRAVATCDIREGNFAAAESHLAQAELAAEVRNSPHDLGANALMAAELSIAQGRSEAARAKLKDARALLAPIGLTYRLDQIDALEKRL